MVDGGPESDADKEIVEHLQWKDILVSMPLSSYEQPYSSRIFPPQNSILFSLRPLQKMTHLRIVVHSNGIDHDPASPAAYSEEFVRAMRASAFDFAGTAALLARPLPSLQYIFLTTSGYLTERDNGLLFWRPYDRWYVDRAWRIANPRVGSGSEHEREPVLMDLHEDVAETIMRNEELVLSEVDSVSVLVRTACEDNAEAAALATRHRSTWARTSTVLGSLLRQAQFRFDT